MPHKMDVLREIDDADPARHWSMGPPPPAARHLPPSARRLASHPLLILMVADGSAVSGVQCITDETLHLTRSFQ